MSNDTCIKPKNGLVMQRRLRAAGLWSFVLCANALSLSWIWLRCLGRSKSIANER